MSITVALSNEHVELVDGTIDIYNVLGMRSVTVSEAQRRLENATNRGIETLTVKQCAKCGVSTLVGYPWEDRWMGTLVRVDTRPLTPGEVLHNHLIGIETYEAIETSFDVNSEGVMVFEYMLGPRTWLNRQANDYVLPRHVHSATQNHHINTGVLFDAV